MTAPYRLLCAKLRLAAVTQSLIYSINQDVLRFKGSKDRHGRVPDLSDNMTHTHSLYQLTLRTSPSEALYEATVSYRNTGEYTVDEKSISRINKYGNQPACISDKYPHLRKYCFCEMASTVASDSSRR